MLDVEKIRKDFPMLQNQPELIYFDNGATTLKPQCVIDAVMNFYLKHTSNIHRGDYQIAMQNDQLFDGTRSVIAKLIGCKSQEVVFTSNVTASLNQVGVLYGKYNLLQKMDPMLLGGDMNAQFDKDGNMKLKDPPGKFEAGTPNIEGVIGLKAAAEYLMNIGLDNIHEYEKELRSYLYEGLSQLDNVVIYNPENEFGPIDFNVKGVIALDSAGFLASRGIAVRSGNHCARALHNVIGTDWTVRASPYFYNTRSEADRFVAAANDISLESATGSYF